MLEIGFMNRSGAKVDFSGSSFLASWTTYKEFDDENVKKEIRKPYRRSFTAVKHSEQKIHSGPEVSLEKLLFLLWTDPFGSQTFFSKSRTKPQVIASNKPLLVFYLRFVSLWDVCVH